MKPTNETLRIIAIIVFVILSQIIFSKVLYAQGNLVLMPRRVVFENGKKFEELNLANTGKDTARYLISLLHLRMKEDGGFEEITDTTGAGNFADRYIRFFPRSVTLAPNESQVVKIQLIRSQGLSEGEYRSHLYFRAVPDLVPKEETVASRDSSLAIRLTPVFGISIPVIVRNGKPDIQVAVDNSSLDLSVREHPVLNMTFLRTGNMSVYGDIQIDYVSSKGKKIIAGSVKGVAVYTPNVARRMRLELAAHPEIDYNSGQLQITYSSQENNQLRVLATSSLVLR